MSRLTLNCNNCGNIFPIPPSRTQTAKYCSLKCYWGEKIKKNCLWCKKNYFVIPSRVNKTKYCSFICGAKFKMTGRKFKHSEETKKQISISQQKKDEKTWEGFSQDKDARERNLFRQTIQKVVLERDNYTCQLCGTRGGILHVDHIQSWAEYIELRFNIKNCRTLCQTCHYKITYGRKMPDNVKNWGLKKEYIV